MKDADLRSWAVVRGAQTRKEILRTSVDVASAEGLEGLTIGRLAKELGLSKSGLFAHFGSKEELQIATIDAARRDFVASVIDPTLDVEPGLARLLAMMEAWIESVEHGRYRGGCFFYAASAEVDDRPGPVRDFLVKLTGSWVSQLKKELRLAVRLGELTASTDIDLLAFQLHGSVQEANWFRRLHGDEKAFDLSRAAMHQVLRLNATEVGLAVLGDR
ncbi:MAG: TetR/AcrR family transcriptional regulator [Pyrinomonadaceae bacterium]